MDRKDLIKDLKDEELKQVSGGEEYEMPYTVIGEHSMGDCPNCHEFVDIRIYSHLYPDGFREYKNTECMVCHCQWVDKF